MANKKSFKSDINPAMQFFSENEIEKEIMPAKQQEIQDKPPEGYKYNPLYVETKSKRLQVLVQPSLYEKLKKRATEEDKSVNEIINILLKDGLERE